MAVLFDLDGTLVDTAPDFHEALITFSHEHNVMIKPEVDYEYLRNLVSNGSKSILINTLCIDSLPEYFVPSFISHYSNTCYQHSVLFPDMQDILNTLKGNNIPWGIVTNKPHKLTTALLKVLKILPAPHCVISGDSAPRAKPYPDPILMACDNIKLSPENCIYVGDAKRDIDAAHSCNMPAIAVEYGYIGKDDNPKTWNADIIVSSVKELKGELLNHFGIKS
ncbi:MAG: HAD-IA family hydrolase [Francisellaceae bacterium]|nr:HAD-IA family hydrolase [Francisellaceae bacterium]MBT6539471.1 HAD-IA family hydrolase [Francisellaceae bacterium]